MVLKKKNNLEIGECDILFIELLNLLSSKVQNCLILFSSKVHKLLVRRKSENPVFIFMVYLPQI